MRSGASNVRKRTPKKPAPKKPPPRRKPAQLSPNDRVGAWRIESELGRGGMGSVYAVTHAGFGKRAALKLCHPSVLTETLAIEMFVREARIVHLIDHPGVPDVFATGTYDRRPYLAMERLHGLSLTNYIESREGVSKTHALDILFEVCSVIEAAHRNRVVHRDIKLDNIFVIDTLPGTALQIKVLDWGVARILDESDPMTGMLAGTLTYVAPEQIRGDELTTAADVYSLGVLAYQLLFGQPPFAHWNDRELILMHLELPPPRPMNLWPEIPTDLESMLHAMLAKEPAQRPAIDEVLRGIITARLEFRSQSDETLELVRSVPPFDLQLGQPALLRFRNAVQKLVARLRGTSASSDDARFDALAPRPETTLVLGDVDLVRLAG